MMLDQRAEDVARLGKDEPDRVAGALLMIAAAIYSIDRTLGQFIEILPRDEDGIIDFRTGP